MIPIGYKHVLGVDIETYSSVDITKSGSFKYQNSPDFEILLIAYSIDGAPAKLIDLLNEDDTSEFYGLFNDPEVLKVAHNDAFERHAFRVYGQRVNISEWCDTMILCAYNGLPMSLDAAGEALGITQKKMREGKALINYFCKPCKPTIANGGRTRNYPEHSPEKWKTFGDYCVRDVDAMMEIFNLLYPLVDVPAWEKLLRQVDAEITERGVLIDTDLAAAAVEVNDQFAAAKTEELVKLTGLDNPNSIQQLMSWFRATGLDVDKLDKTVVADLLTTVKDPVTRRVLELRQMLGKTSTTKYTTMLTAADSDRRVRGILQYYGAGRTGRWAGRLVQVQNLPQNHLDDIADVRELVRMRDLEALEMLYPDVPGTLSQLIRTALVAPEGETFLVADYSAIEARVIAYLAGVQWRMDAFARGEDIYCASASQAFKVPVVKHGINGELRQKGKIMELACIAEGSLVTTDQGLVPIQDVTTDMKVWDGENWVEHEGVVYNGRRRVIKYEGLYATPEHIVFTVDGLPAPFSRAKSKNLDIRVTSRGRDLRTGIEYSRVYDILNAGPHHRYMVSGVVVHNCGYGGGISALKAFGADRLGLTEDEMQDLVTRWRQASPEIPNLWREAERAAKNALTTPGRTFRMACGVAYRRDKYALRCQLPSGRIISYWGAHIDKDQRIAFMAQNQVTRKWEESSTWGGKLVENIVQSYARDCLAVAIIRLTQRGYKIVFHVHDEIIVEAPIGSRWEDMAEVMAMPIKWAPGLLLRADGYETPFYMKD